MWDKVGMGRGGDGHEDKLCWEGEGEEAGKTQMQRERKLMGL